jgi:hypothetical protein
LKGVGEAGDVDGFGLGEPAGVEGPTDADAPGETAGEVPGDDEVPDEPGELDADGGTDAEGSPDGDPSGEPDGDPDGPTDAGTDGPGDDEAPSDAAGLDCPFVGAGVAKPVEGGADGPATDGVGLFEPHAPTANAERRVTVMRRPNWRIRRSFMLLGVGRESPGDAVARLVALRPAREVRGSDHRGGGEFGPSAGCLRTLAP